MFAHPIQMAFMSLHGGGRIFSVDLGANTDVIAQTLAHGVDHWEKYFFCVHIFGDVLDPGQKNAAKIWVRQQGAGEPARRTPPAIEVVPLPWRRTVALHP